jgi:hypothetical protein
MKSNVKNNPMNLARLNVSIILISSIQITLLFSSCDQFVNVDPPRTEIVRATVFENEATANAAVSAIYHQMISESFARGGISSVTFIASLSSDELLNYNAGGSDQDFQQFNENSILPTNVKLTTIWKEAYEYVYKANAIIEGLQTSGNISDKIRNQLTGEAKFVRAFSHFYLVNLFGDVPLVLTTDYRSNARTPRVPASEVYDQIARDLVDAQNLLMDDFSYSKYERIRPSKWTASALLARVYLYTGDWAKAEVESASIINSELFSLSADLNDVFLKNSNEAIWQLMPSPGANTAEAATFIFSNYPSQATLSSWFVENFEAGDERVTSWIGTASDGTNAFYYPFKYKLRLPTEPTLEYSMIFRLAEQYLIRAEARVHQDKLEAAREDLNAIRSRSGLGNTLASDKGDFLLAIEQERRSELFTEWGHRWLDLKRTGRADMVLSALKANWLPTDVLYPIPQSQILNDPSMTDAQNPGY